MASSASQAGFRSTAGGERGHGSAQVPGHRRGAEDGARNAVTVEQRDEHQHEPDRRARQQRLGLAQGQRPGDHGRGRHLARRHPDLLPPAGEVVPVVPAGQGGIRDHRGGLGERQRLAAERLDQVNGALALGRVHAEALGQAVQGLPDAEEPDRDDLRPAPARSERGLGAGDRHPPAGPSGQSPSRSVGSCRSSRTTSQGWSVALSQRQGAPRSIRPCRRARCRTPRWRPVRTRRARPPGWWRRSRSVRRWQPIATTTPRWITAIWVLPHTPGQFGGLSAKAEPARAPRRTRDEHVHDAASGVGPVGESLGQRGHLADAESPCCLLSWHSSWGPTARHPQLGIIPYRTPSDLLLHQ